MARTREFDLEVVLDAAQELFWTRGFRATSLDDLVELTGVGKTSIYGTFGSKADLFLTILERYHACGLAQSVKTLQKAATARDAIRAWLLEWLPLSSGKAGSNGCLSVNTSLEWATVSDDVRTSIKTFQAATQSLLREAFERGRQNGEFASDFDVEGAARMLFIAHSGLLVVARTSPSKSLTLASMEHILGAILPPKHRD